MSPRPALITQAEVSRVIRAAKKEGVAAIEVRPDGSIFIQLVPESTERPNKKVANERVVRL